MGLHHPNSKNAKDKNYYPVNCKQKLALWKTSTDFISVGFTPRSNDICADKDLKIGHLLDIRALSKPLGLTTNWTPEGKPHEALVTGSSSNYLDAAEGDASSKGFAVMLDRGSKLTTKGWYKFSGAFGLPFWGIHPVDFGLENKADTLHRKKSVILDKGEMSDIWDTTILNNSAKDKLFMANYTWGSTGLGLSLPVTYNAADADKESIFLGKKKEADLGVMSASAGINYIKPQDTKISFGASADFEAMANLNIQVNLNDPESIDKVDSFLGTFGISGRPLHNTIGLILNPLHEAETYADKGLLLGMEELGLLALKEGTDELGFDPFEEVSNTFVKIHALPTQAITMTEDYILEQIDRPLMFVHAMLNDTLEENGAAITDDINASIRNAISILEDVDKGFKKLDQLKAQIKDVNKTLNLISPTENWNLLNAQISKILPPKSGCDIDSLMTKSDLFKPVETLKKNVKMVNDKLQAVDIATVKSFASKVESKIDFDTSDLIDTFEKTQTVARSINNEIITAQGKVDVELTKFCTQADTIRSDIEKLVTKADKFDPIKTKLQSYINQVYGVLDSDTTNQVRLSVKRIHSYLSGLNITIEPMTDEQREIWTGFSSKLLLLVLENITIDGKNLEGFKVDLTKLQKKIPQPTADELRSMVVTRILDTEAVKAIRVTMNDAISPVMDEVRDVAVDLISSANQVVYDVLDKLSAKANEVLASATSVVESMPIKSGKMDGYANISGDEVERVHIGAEWAVDSGKEDTSYKFNGALDMERWGAGGKAGCGGSDSGDGNMDVKISTRDIKMTLGGKKLSIDSLYFGFTLAEAVPIGIMGGVESKAGFDFNEFKLYDMKLFLGIGSEETYLGATTAAIFEKYQMNVAFLLGRTCGREIITALDPKVGKFITLPDNVFAGAYIRGGASFPIWNNGCALTVGVSANLGAWYVIPGTYGGLIGGGAYGKALCIASLRGEIETRFEKSGDTVKFDGKGWGAAGVGWCSPSSWTSVSKSRNDDWCGTGDAQFGATYDNGWHLDPPKTSAVH